MNDVTIFENAQFGQIRTAGTSEQPLFCLADICKVLELRTTDVKNRLKADGVDSIGVIDSMGREQVATFINEQNLYKVIMRSDKPQAEAFQDWVCGEVLPSIRKQGAYVSNTIDDEQVLRVIEMLQDRVSAQKRQLQIADGTIEEQQKQIEAMRPDAEYTQEVLQSVSTYAISDVAKEMRMSGNKLYAKLKERGILFRRGGKWFPYEKYTPQGYFATRTIPYTHRDGSHASSSYTVLTEKGRKWIHSLNLNNA